MGSPGGARESRCHPGPAVPEVLGRGVRPEAFGQHGCRGIICARGSSPAGSPCRRGRVRVREDDDVAAAQGPLEVGACRGLSIGPRLKRAVQQKVIADRGSWGACAVTEVAGPAAWSVGVDPDGSGVTGRQDESPGQVPRFGWRHAAGVWGTRRGCGRWGRRGRRVTRLVVVQPRWAW